MKRLAGVAFGLVLIAAMAAVFGLRDGSSLVLACDAATNTDNPSKAQVIFAKWQSSAEAQSSYRVVGNSTESTKGGILSTAHSEMQVDQMTKRSIGFHESSGGGTIEVFKDEASGSAFYRYPGGIWETKEAFFPYSSASHKDAPFWNCEPTDVEVVSDGAKSSIIHLRYVFISQHPQDRGNLHEDVFLDARTHLPTKRISTWDQFSESKDGKTLSWRVVRTCEFFGFNVPVVFPDDLPKSSLGF